MNVTGTHASRALVRTRVLGVASAVVLVGVMLASTALAGCGSPKAPSGPAGIVGQIQSIERAGDGWSMLVVGGPQAAGAVSDKAMCRITDKTTIVDTTGAEIAADQLTAGATVAVWFEGAVAESYPVQGTASYVQMRTPSK